MSSNISKLTNRKLRICPLCSILKKLFLHLAFVLRTTERNCQVGVKCPLCKIRKLKLANYTRRQVSDSPEVNAGEITSQNCGWGPVFGLVISHKWSFSLWSSAHHDQLHHSDFIEDLDALDHKYSVNYDDENSPAPKNEVSIVMRIPISVVNSAATHS